MLGDLRLIVTQRKLIGLYLGQFGLVGTTWFFLTWFPTYLVTYRHLTYIKAGLFASLPDAKVTDTTTNTTWQQTLSPYNGPVSGLQDQFIDVTPDNLNVSTTQANVFLHSGAGEDAE